MELTAVQSAIASAIQAGILPSRLGEFKIVRYDHHRPTYSSHNITMPITWQLVEGVWISYAGGSVLVDENK